MSDVRTTNGSTEAQTITLPEDVLSRIVSETERAFTARAARPSPIHLKSWEEIERFAEKAARSGMVPKDYVGKPDAICIAVQMGSELGLAPMQSLTNIAVVNGRPAVWGDAMPGLCRSSGMCRSIREWHGGAGDELTYYCEAIRRDDPNPVVQSFSVTDAKKAGLWGKNVWASYPARMLQMRARGFALRDAFPDVLRGLISAEEAADIPWEDTGLPPVGAQPVATAQPIAAPKSRSATAVVDDIEAKARGATTADDLDQLERDDDVRKVRENLAIGRPQRDRMEALITFHRERIAAFEQGPPPDDLDRILDGEPADADALHAEALIALIRGAASAEAVGAILGHDMQANWMRRAMTERKDLAGQVIAACDSRIAELRAP